MNLNDVQQTLFFPLMGRAEAARRSGVPSPVPSFARRDQIDGIIR